MIDFSKMKFDWNPDLQGLNNAERRAFRSLLACSKAQQQGSASTVNKTEVTVEVVAAHMKVGKATAATYLRRVADNRYDLVRSVYSRRRRQRGRPTVNYVPIWPEIEEAKKLEREKWDQEYQWREKINQGSEDSPIKITVGNDYGHISVNVHMQVDSKESAEVVRDFLLENMDRFLPLSPIWKEQKEKEKKNQSEPVNKFSY